ncbi:MAG: tyrosine-type recombinase/integrase [Armatimonadota bacterium]
MSLATAPHSNISLPLSVAISEFLAECRLRQFSAGTVQWYQYSLLPFERFATARGETEAAAVTAATVRAFLAERSTEVQARRLNHYRDSICRLYDWLKEQGHVSQNPVAGIGKAKESRKLIEAFRHEEVEALLAQPDTNGFLGLRDHVFMLLLLDTGLRLQEALGLQVGDLDLSSGSFKVLGKGRKERLIGVSQALEGHLRRYLRRRDAALAAAGLEGRWLLPNQIGGRWSAKGAQDRLKLYARQADVTRVRVSPHTFRHTFALWFVRNGGSPFHLQKILGHTSLDMSRRYCDLADIDFISSQQQLSPLTTSQLGQPKRQRTR